MTSAKISQGPVHAHVHGQAAGNADGQKCSADITGCLGFFAEVFVLAAARWVPLRLGLSLTLCLHDFSILVQSQTPAGFPRVRARAWVVFVLFH